MRKYRLIETILLLSVIITISIIYRLLPYLDSKLPFSIDSWPLIRDTSILYKYTPIDFKNRLFDNYNIYWPGLIIRIVVLARILNINPYSTALLFTPIMNSFAILIMYAILKRMGFKKPKIFLPLIILAVLYPPIMFSMSITKESGAQPLYLLLILLLLIRSHNNFSDVIGRMILIIVIESALIITHHLTSFITLIILSSFLVYLFGDLSKINLYKCVEVIYSISSLIVLGYFHYISLGYYGLKLPPFGIDRITTLVCYVIFGLTIAYIIDTRGVCKKIFDIPWIILSLFVAIIAILGSAFIGISELIIKLPSRYMVYSIPYIIIGVLIPISMCYLWRDRNAMFTLYWFSSIASIQLYSLLASDPFFSSIAYRIFNFILIPLIPLSLSLLNLKELNNRTNVTVLAALIIFIILPFNVRCFFRHSVRFRSSSFFMFLFLGMLNTFYNNI